MGASTTARTTPWAGDVAIPADGVELEGALEIPPRARGLVLFAHGSGSSRHSRRNRQVAHALRRAGLATLLFDLLTRDEERTDAITSHLRFDIGLLATRLGFATRWAQQDGRTMPLRVGYFGASTGAAAALIAASANGAKVGAVVSRGGRPDLAGGALRAVRAPTLLIVGGADEPVIPLNEDAFAALSCRKRLAIVPGADHLFEERGALETVADLAATWFTEHLGAGE